MRLRDEHWGDVDRDPAKLIETAVGEGITFVDTAEMYGNEDVVGRAIRAHRDHITLCSKFGVYWGDSGGRDDWSVRADPATVRTAIEGSLRRLNVDTVDLYYLHHRSDETPIEDTVTAMAELKQAGKIRALGLSNVTTEDIERAHAVHPISAVQQPWSLDSREVESMIPVLENLGIALVAHSPISHGRLATAGESILAKALASISSATGATPGQIALSWVHHRSRQTGTAVVPIPGTGSIAHLRKNAAAARISLSEDDIHALDTATRIGDA